MLKNADIKKINKVCIAENSKIEGLSTTSRRILNAGCDDSISYVIKSSYERVVDDMNHTLDDYYPGHYKHLEAYMNVIGFWFCLPLNLSFCYICMLGAEFKTLILKLREEKYLSDLVSSGVIEEKDIPKLLEKISNLDSYYRTRNDIGEELVEEYYSDEKGSMKF